MVKVEAVRIDQSPTAAPLFTLIVGPLRGSQRCGPYEKGNRRTLRHSQAVVDNAAPKSDDQNELHAHIAPSEYNWVGTSSGFRGLNYNYVVLQQECRVELFIDRGKETEKENKRIFDQLAAKRSVIESIWRLPELGAPRRQAGLSY
jgi:hypothetical protein